MCADPADDPVLQAEGLGKAYRIWASPGARLAHPLGQAALGLLPRSLRPATLGSGRLVGSGAWRDFHALRGLDLSVRRGEAVGIIGRNGSGKSTLLQLVAGTLTPSSGRVRTRGRVAALLELGSGFNPEFTGRENVLLNATVLGLSRRQAQERFDSIAAYAEIGAFIEQPVRTYSSGMMLRLAFAVAAHVDPDLLIVDEALGVGDARFQLKCARTIDQFLERGVTLLFVSHDNSSIKRLCNRAILLEQGMLVHEGPPNEVVNLYSKLVAEGGSLEGIAEDIRGLKAGRGSGAGLPRAGGAGPGADAGPSAGAPLPLPAPGPGPAEGDTPALLARIAVLEEALRSVPLVPPARASALLAPAPAPQAEFSYGGGGGEIERIHILDARLSPRPLFVSGEDLLVVADLVCREPLSEPIFALTLKNSAGVEVYGTNTLFSGQPAGPLAAGERRRVVFRMPLNLMAGHYFVSVGFTHFVGEELVVVHRRYDAASFEVVARDRTFGIANLNARISVHPLEGEGP